MVCWALCFTEVPGLDVVGAEDIAAGPHQGMVGLEAIDRKDPLLVRMLVEEGHGLIDDKGRFGIPLGKAHGLGHDFLNKVSVALEDIGRNPDRWPVLRFEIRRRLIHRFP